LGSHAPKDTPIQAVVPFFMRKPIKAHCGVSNARSSFTGYTPKRTQSGRYFVMCRAKALRFLLSRLSKIAQNAQHNHVSHAAALEHGKVRPLPSYDSNLTEVFF
jgi:hypothetical protein